LTKLSYNQVENLFPVIICNFSDISQLHQFITL